jgi:hypothetical protein
MENQEEGLFFIQCPCCRARLWVDPLSREVVQAERAGKPKSSLDDLLAREKQKKETMDRKFSSTAELARKKKAEAQDKFAQAFGKADEED